MAESIVEVLYNQSKITPEKLCIVDIDGENTYSQVWEKIKIVAQNLLNKGVKEGDCVMVECTQDARYLITDFACELVGAVFVPVEHKAASDRVKMISEETEAVLFINDANYIVESKTCVFDDVFKECSILSDTEFPAGEKTAEILYTTGTTGKSKGIEITNANNIALAENIKYGTEMKEDNIELVPLPISHSHGLRCCYANILNGGTIVLVDGVMQIGYVFQMLDKYNVTAIDLSPSAAAIILKLSRGEFADYNDKLDYIQIGTAALPEETKASLIKELPDVRMYNFYGSTESGRSCVLDFNADNKPHCIGKPTVNAKFIVTDENRCQINSSKDNTGLLASAGSMNMKGYWKQEELTKKTMQNGYVYTNDLGYIDEEGFVYVFGRKDDIINYKGIKIAPEEIEESVKLHPNVVDCACVPKKDKISGQVPKLFVELKDKEAYDRKEFKQFLKERIDDNKQPKEVEIIDKIPRTSNGKIQRIKLIED